MAVAADYPDIVEVAHHAPDLVGEPVEFVGVALDLEGMQVAVEQRYIHPSTPRIDDHFARRYGVRPPVAAPD
ncbi:hypothetical protein PHAMO_280129 [Magnetospirillum molischianum DSM 120]|uniref:Uncharacterized protein n=1 Tax=Magnetospirillum molischianum DSM 120 TaxID=1150626 RepID=H8FTA7_MAGML|nr:hypothetical protein PHAMO_280129 [Magnetospirillum molischianum DSM 120]